MGARSGVSVISDGSPMHLRWRWVIALLR